MIRPVLGCMGVMFPSLYKIRPSSARALLGPTCLMLGATLALGGCSMSLDGGRPDNTSSIGAVPPPQIEAPAIQAFVEPGSWPALEATLIQALTEGEDGERKPWTSAETGESGVVTAISTNGQMPPCRRIAVTAVDAEGAAEILANACFAPPTIWKIGPVEG